MSNSTLPNLTSEAFCRVLFESSPDCIKLLDLDGHLLSMNEAGQRLMEIDNFAMFKGACWLDFWPQRTLVQEAITIAKAGGEGHFQGFCPTAQGTPKWWEVRVTHVSQPDAAQALLLAVSRDMTEQKHAEQRLVIEHAITKVLMEATSLDTAAPAIVAAFCQQLHIEVSEFWLLAQDQAQILCTARSVDPHLAQSNSYQAFSQYNSFAHNICLAGRAWQRKSPVWIQEMADDPHFWRRAPLDALNLHAGLAFPILNGAEFLGVITLFARQPFMPEQALLDLMATTSRNISQFVERQRAETTLRQSTEQIRFQVRLLDAVEQAVIATDLNGQVLHWNRFAERLYGWKATETIGGRLESFISAGTTREQAYEIMAVLMQGQSWAGEFWVRRRDGTIFPAYVIDSPIYDEQNQLVGLVGVSIDISERKAVAEAARVNAERFRSLANAIPQIVWINNSAGEHEYFNERWLTYTGLGYEASLADSGQVIHPDDRAQVVAMWQNAYAQGVTYEHEMRLRRADGAYRWHLIRTVPVRDAEGKIINWYGTSTDIDDRKRAELSQRFLTDLTNQLRMLADPEEIRWTLVRALGEYLGVDRCGLHEVDIATDCITIQGSWRRQGVPSQAGVYPLSSFMSPELQSAVGAGQSAAIDDVSTDPRTAVSAENYQQLKVCAFVFTPYLEQGRWVALLGLDCAMPRVWQADEVALVETVATRFWPLIEKARAEQALRTSAMQLRLITDAIPGLISYVDAEQRYRFVNAAYETWFGRTRAQILGCHMREIVGAETYAQIEQHVKVALAGQQVTFQQVYPRADGARRTAMVTYVPQIEDDAPSPIPQVVGFHILLTDITELKEAEAALRVSEEQSRRQLAELQAVYTTAPVGLAVLDCDLCFVRLNERLAEINGRPIHEHQGRTVREIVPNIADIVEPLFRQVIATGEPLLALEIDGETAAQPGVRRSWLESCYPLLTSNAQVIGLNLVVQEITERKQYEEELKQLNETLDKRVKERTRELTQRYEELDRFAYIASHDLKAPLRAIEHLASWIEEDTYALLPVRSQEHLAKMRGRIKRMEGLLDDLLAYSRADRYRSTPEKVNTDRLVQEIVKLLALPEGFTVTTAPEMPTFVTERVPLELVLRNLISNAIKHHHRRDGHVMVKAQDQGTVIEFAVIDDGPGIDPKFHERIFQMFQTLQPRDKVEGSGIGLAVVKKVLEGLGGTITVESAEGQGATFRFTWPK